MLRMRKAPVIMMPKSVHENTYVNIKQFTVSPPSVESFRDSSNLNRILAMLPRVEQINTGPILDIDFVHFQPINEPINWSAKFPGRFTINVKEQPDYIDTHGLYSYDAAKPTYKSRVEIELSAIKDHSLRLILKTMFGNLVRDGKFVHVSRKYPNHHANTNRAFQIFHECLFRAIAIQKSFRAAGSYDKLIYKEKKKIRDDAVNKLRSKCGHFVPKPQF